jgi:hypothetical protein
MKQLLFCLLAASLLAACNNDKTADKGSVATSASPEDKEPEGSGTSCASFLWFKKGTVLGYEIKGLTNIITHTTTTITDVRQDGAALVADYTTELDNGKKLSASYRCEGSKLYVDMKSLFNDMMSGLQKSGMKFEVTDSYISFPWDMKEGDDLEQSVFELTAKQNGKDFMKMRRIVNDRHVGAIEKVTTPAGTFTCLKITENATTSTSMMGREMPKKTDKSIQWFAPQAGLVKTESYDSNDKLQYTTELSSIK